VTKIKGQLIGPGTQIKVIAKDADRIPGPGDAAPRPTLSSQRQVTRRASTRAAPSTTCTPRRFRWRVDRRLKA
jgi:hypothetical protein